MWQIFSIFFRAEGTRPWLVLLCLLLAGTLEAVGIGTLLPAMASLLNRNGQASLLDVYAEKAISTIGFTPSFEAYLLLAVALLTLRSLFLFGAMTYTGITSARVANSLRRRLIKAVFDARWTYYADQSTGRVASVLSNDATRAGDAYNAAAIVVAAGVQITAYVVVALLINWRVAILALGGGLLISLGARRLLKISTKAGFKQSDRTASLTADMVDLVQNMKPLKAMHRYDRMIENLSAQIRSLRRALYTQNVARFGLVYGSDLLMVLIIAAAALFAVKWSGVPLEQLLVVAILFFQVMAYVTKLLRQFQAAAQIQASYLLTNEMISRAESLKEAEFGDRLPPECATITFKNVKFAHGETVILNQANVKIAPGKVTVLQGPSGAGKTTLIDLLIGLHQVQSGEIHIGNVPLAEVDIMAFRRKLGYVPQDLTLFHDTIRENISLSEPGISDDDILSALEQSGAKEFIAALPNGLDTDVGEFGGKLSGGQRQRISLARAIVRKPELLVLDEVTSALDPDTEAAIVSNIGRLRGRYTIIAITHRPAWTQIADVLYEFSAGTVKEVKKRSSA